MPNPISNSRVRTQPGLGEPASPLFRHRALQAYQRGEELASLLRVAGPSSWALLGTLGALVLAAVALCGLSSIEVTSQGRGMLRASHGSYTLSAHVSGRVLQVLVHAGAEVAAGQAIAVIEQPARAAELVEATSRWRLARAQLTEAQGPVHERLQHTLALLGHQAQLIERRLGVEQQGVAALRVRREAYTRLERAGAVAPERVETIDEQLRAAQQHALSTQEQAAQARIEISTRQQAYDTELAQRQSDEAQARARRDALQHQVHGGRVVATQAGRVDTLLVRPGELAQLGAPIARIVPLDRPLRSIVAFIDEKDRAFLKPGSRARVSLDPLLPVEFGRLSGSVVRIGSQLASLAEVRDVLGDTVTLPGPSYEVEVEVGTDASNVKLLSMLRGASLVSVQFQLRKRRILALVFEPVQRWLD